MMKKDHLINAVLVVFSTLIALLLCELLYRSYVVIATKKKIYEPSSSITFYHDKTNLFDRKNGFSYNPDTQEYVVQIEGNKATFCGLAFYINPFGTFEKNTDFKNVQSDAKKTGSRILVFGASFTTIPHEGETWVSIFSKKFKEKIDPNVQVLNFGRDGYGIAQMLILAANTFPKWNPDIILIAFTSANLSDDRFWRNSFEVDGRGYTYVAVDPNDNEASVDSKISLFFDNRITKQWCEKVMNNGGEDPQIKDMVEFYEKARKAELYKTAPDFFAPQSYLYNRIVHGEIIPHHYDKSVHNIRLRDDPEALAAIKKLNDSKIPYYFVHFPLLPEMKKDVRWELTIANQVLVKDLIEAADQKQILFLSDYMHLSKDQLERFPVNDQDGHPSKDGIIYIADGMLNLYKDKDIPKIPRDTWMGSKQEVLTKQVTLSPLLDSPEGWSFQYAKAKDHGSPGVVVGPQFRNVFAQPFTAKENEQFKIITRASMPKAKWNIFGLAKQKTMGRFQINWSNSKGEYIDTYLEPFEVTPKEKTYETYVVAPPGTETGTLYVSPSGNDDVVRYTEMKLLGKENPIKGNSVQKATAH